jgi:ABC-type bacteriocin/lantibiotic exporter with double-glycine peptidase domain
MHTPPRDLVAPAVSHNLILPVSATPSHEAWEPLQAGASPLARLWLLLHQERRLVLTIYFYAALGGLFSLTLPLGVQAIIGLVSGGLILQPVVLLIAFVILGTLAHGGLQLLQLSVVEAVQQRVFARLALDLTGRLSRVRLDRVTGLNLPELMNRFFEIKTIQKSLGKLLTDWVTAGLQVGFGLLLLTFYHPYFSLFGVGLIGVLALIFYFTAPRGWETSLGESKYKYRVAHWLEELARASRAFKFSGGSPLPLDRMDARVSGYLGYRQAHFKVLVAQSLAFVGFKTAITAALLILGATLVVNRQITLGQFVASEIVIVTVLLSVEKLILGLADVYDILTALEKAGQAATLPNESLQGVVPVVGDQRGMRVELRDVAYAYADGSGRALQDVSFSVAPGSRLAVIGPPGSGESTLLNVMALLYPAYSGSLTLDGISARDLDHLRVRADIAWCGPDVDLFDGTIEDNISLGRAGIRTEQVLEMAERVGLNPWLHRLPDGFATEVEAHGVAVPRGVAKRLVLARALIGNPRLLLLDSFLDDEMDPVDRRVFADLVLQAREQCTVVLVTHNVELLARCDRVVVLSGGRVSTQGTWREVVESDAYAQQLEALR